MFVEDLQDHRKQIKTSIKGSRIMVVGAAGRGTIRTILDS
jgi:hypothetical protein